MRSAVYLETTIISYLTAWPSRDLVVAARQQLTREWWENARGRFDAYVSDLVIQEASQGDAEAVRLGIAAIEGIEVLQVPSGALPLARKLVTSGPIPPRAVGDALHVAIAATAGMDYLLTWNCAHLANAEMRRAVEQAVHDAGYDCPEVCTPEELMGL